MDAVKFIEERNRMCKAHLPDCEGCRVDEAKPGISECFHWILENPEKAIQFVEEWSAAHPRKTRQDVFLEQWPEARTYGDGILCLCPKDISSWRRGQYGECINGGIGCDSCRREFWGQEVEQ